MMEVIIMPFTKTILVITSIMITAMAMEKLTKATMTNIMYIMIKMMMEKRMIIHR